MEDDAKQGAEPEIPGLSTDQQIASLITDGFRPAEVEDDEPEGGPPTENVAPDEEHGTEGEPEANAGDDAADDASEGGEPDGDEDPELERWASALLDKPRSLSQIPGALRTQAVERALEKSKGEAESVRQAAVQAVQYLNGKFEEEMAARLEEARKEWAEYADLDAATEEELGAILRDDPVRARRYAEYRARQAGGSEAAKAPAQPEAGSVPGDIAELVTEVNSKPAVLAKLQAKEKASPGIYAPTPEGMAAFRRDANRFLGMAEAESRQPDPEEKEAERRRNSAAERKALPRIDASSGRQGPAPLPHDVGVLLHEAFREELTGTKR